jgi:hypothetical protein
MHLDLLSETLRPQNPKHMRSLLSDRLLQLLDLLHQSRILCLETSDFTTADCSRGSLRLDSGIKKQSFETLHSFHFELTEDLKKISSANSRGDEAELTALLILPQLPVFYNLSDQLYSLSTKKIKQTLTTLRLSRVLW